MVWERGAPSLSRGGVRALSQIKKFFARALRKNPTKTEDIVWQSLRNRNFLNLKFRRQHVIKGYIVDFFCKELNLAIEIDGKIHEKQKTYDAHRQETLLNYGINIIRATNSEIMEDFNILLNRIKSVKDKLSQI